MPAPPFLPWSVILEGSLQTVLQKRMAFAREHKEVTFQSPKRKLARPTCGSRYLVPSLLPGLPAPPLSDPKQGHLQGSVRPQGDKTFHVTLQTLDAPQGPTQTFNRETLCSGTESSLTL